LKELVEEDEVLLPGVGVSLREDKVKVVLREKKSTIYSIKKR